MMPIISALACLESFLVKVAHACPVVLMGLVWLKTTEQMLCLSWLTSGKIPAATKFLVPIGPPALTVPLVKEKF